RFCRARNCGRSGEDRVSPRVLGIFLNRHASPSHAVGVSAGSEMCVHYRERRMSADQAILWAQCKRVLGALDGFLVPALNGYGGAEQAVRQCETGVQLHCTTERAFPLSVTA